MNLLRLEDLSVQNHGQVRLHGINLIINPGELFGIIGPNGAGKSTLLKAIAQLLPYQGHIWWQDQLLNKFSPQERARKLSYLGQENLLHCSLRVADLVALGRYPYHNKIKSQRALIRDQKSIQAIEIALQLTEISHLRSRIIDTLSTGERARVRLSRALAVQAPILLADEPVAALDPRYQLQILELLKNLCQTGMIILLVLHDLTLASRFCDRLLLLQQGAPVILGQPFQVLTPLLLSKVYGIRAIQGEYEQQTYFIPWVRELGLKSS